jgi:hypothetical protein
VTRGAPIIAISSTWSRPLIMPTKVSEVNDPVLPSPKALAVKF